MIKEQKEAVKVLELLLGNKMIEQQKLNNDVFVLQETITMVKDADIKKITAGE